MMQVLILEDDQTFQAQLAQAMMGKGFNVLCVETVSAAEAFLRLDMADVLIFGERIGGRLSHPVALLAECRNPLVAAVLLTERTGPDLDELFDLMPALVGILGRRVSPAVVSQVVMAAVADMASDSVRRRLAARWAAAEGAGTEVPAARLAPPAPAAAADPGLAAALLDDAAAAIAEPTPPVSVQTMVPDPAVMGFGWDGLWRSEIAAMVADQVTPSPLPARSPSARPSPDSPLARVMAAGNRALGRPVAPSRGPALPAWLDPAQAMVGAPASPLPPADPMPRILPRPADGAGRRLHLA